MMPGPTLTVRTADGGDLTHKGTGWSVDSNGHLHIIGPPGTGNVATIHRDHWVAISRSDQPESLPEPV